MPAVGLSGGQRQRAAIARALYGDPQVLVFDEATSALDVPTERAIRGTISRLGGERTIVTITHRMGSLADCDTIFVLEDGAITASGSHEALSRDNHSFRLLSDGRVESAMNAAAMEFGTKGETLARLAPLVADASFCAQILFSVELTGTRAADGLVQPDHG